MSEQQQKSRKNVIVEQRKTYVYDQIQSTYLKERMYVRIFIQSL